MDYSAVDPLNLPLGAGLTAYKDAETWNDVWIVMNHQIDTDPSANDSYVNRTSGAQWTCNSVTCDCPTETIAPTALAIVRTGLNVNTSPSIDHDTDFSDPILHVMAMEQDTCNPVGDFNAELHEWEFDADYPPNSEQVIASDATCDTQARSWEDYDSHTDRPRALRDDLRDPPENPPRVPPRFPVPLPICFGPRMALPPFVSTLSTFPELWRTELCFVAEFGAITDWPATGCCPPLKSVGACSLPSTAGVVGTYKAAVGDADFQALWASPGWIPANPIEALQGLQLYLGAIALLRDNIDIVKWVACLVNDWSPDMQGQNLPDCLAGLVLGTTPSTVSVIGAFAPQPNGTPTAAAYTMNDPRTQTISGSVGVILPVAVAWWPDVIAHYLRDFAVGGEASFCASVAVAKTILHEFVHICGDGPAPSTNHNDPDPLGFTACWDECRMIDSAFQWAMAQRFPCITGNCAPCVGFMADPAVFAYSWITTTWTHPCAW
jgi:hypothetical protein